MKGILDLENIKYQFLLIDLYRYFIVVNLFNFNCLFLYKSEYL